MQDPHEAAHSDHAAGAPSPRPLPTTSCRWRACAALLHTVVTPMSPDAPSINLLLVDDLQENLVALEALIRDAGPPHLHRRAPATRRCR